MNVLIKALSIIIAVGLLWLPISSQVSAAVKNTSHRPSLGVCIVADEEITNEQIDSAGRALQQEAKATARYIMIDGPSSYQLADIFDEVPTFEKDLAIGVQQLSEGRRKYNQLALDDVLEHLGRAEHHLIRASAFFPDAIDALVEVYKYQGATHLIKADEDSAKQAYSHLLNLREDYILDRASFPPMMVDVFTSTYAEVAYGKKGTLIVTSEPKGAEIFLDGKQRGQTPISISELSEGKHLLSVKKDGFRVWSQQVEVKGNKESPIEVTLYGGADKKQMHRLAKELDRYPTSEKVWEKMMATGGALGTEVLLIGKLTREGENLVLDSYLYNLPKRTLVNSATSIFNTGKRLDETALEDTIETIEYEKVDEEGSYLDDSSLDGALTESIFKKEEDSQILVSDKQVKEIKPTIDETKQSSRELSRAQAEEEFWEPLEPLKEEPITSKSKKRFYKRWWFWTIVAAVVAGGVAGVALATMGGGGSSTGMPATGTSGTGVSTTSSSSSSGYGTITTR